MYYTGEVFSSLRFQLIGDNVDIEKHASHQTLEKRNQNHHWFHIMAVRDRVEDKILSDIKPKADIKKLPLHTFLPSVEDCQHLHKEFVILAVRVLVENLSAFKQFSKVVPEHIPHKYSSVMSKKSEIVSNTSLYLSILQWCIIYLYPYIYRFH